jgi:anaerobic selenocysteine-containing dehydrogenase
MAKVADRLGAAGNANMNSVRFLLSAHASHEEFFLFRRLNEDLIGDPTAGVTVAWTFREKAQPPHTKFKVPPVDAANVNGARIFGFVSGEVGTEQGTADTLALRNEVESGHVLALYVFDPGPEGSLGDVTWITRARADGKLPLLIVQGVVLTELARAADFVLPGAAYIEKEASYTNDKGRLQGAARAIPPPGEAMEDWQLLVNLAVALGVRLEYTAAAHVRADIAARFGSVKGIEGITTLAFARPVTARNWLQASNPSERWKWDFMFQDLPPIKGELDPTALPLPPGAIPLKVAK